MARPRVFVSSTYYDLKHLRSSLENFIETLGYDPILSEKGDIAYVPDAPLDESCYREVRNADIYVLIIGGRYGSERSGRSKTPKSFFERYDSITKLEYKSAVAQDVPIYILIERSVYADYENYLRNRDNTTFNYAHVDSSNIFHLIEEILGQARNNPVYQFDRYNDIEAWLKEQWAGFFKELLTRSTGQQQIASLSVQVTQLAEINQTLKRYLEEVMSKVAPEKSAQLIRNESKRLEGASRLLRASGNPLVTHMAGYFDLETVLEKLAESPTLDALVQKLAEISPEKASRFTSFMKESYALNDFAKARHAIGLPAPLTPKISSPDIQMGAELPIASMRKIDEVPESPSKKIRKKKGRKRRKKTSR